MKALLIGYGNPGRGDDGLGQAFAERIDRLALPGLEVDIDYQLTVEHALAVSGVDLVIFVDAEMGNTELFRLRPVTASGNPDISSHELSPQSVLALCSTLYGKAPQAFVLGISGSVFGDVREGLSAIAQDNLENAVSHFLNWYAEQANILADAGNP
jgi:hydrogenase maturation protease